MMNKNLKNILIAVNVLMLILAVYWYSQNSEIEPIIIFFGQIASILILLFEGKLSENSVKKVSKSKVRISTTKEDNTNIKVENIKKGSDVKIKRK